MSSQAIRLDRYELVARREINRVLIQEAEQSARRKAEAELRDPHRGEFIANLRNPREID